MPRTHRRSDGYLLLTEFRFLGAQAIAHIIWAVEGVKPVALIGLQEEVPHKAICRLINTLFAYRLCVNYRRRMVDKGHYSVLLTCGLNPEEVEAEGAMDFTTLTMAERDRRRGTLYGYPATAIEGYVNHIVADKEVLRSIYSKEERTFFERTSPFVLSGENWHQEAEVVKEWMRILQAKAPATYEHLMRKSKRQERKK